MLCQQWSSQFLTFFHAVPLHPLEHIFSQQRWWACYMTSKLWSTAASHRPQWQRIPAWALHVLDHLFCCSPFCVHSVPLGSSGSCGEHDDFTHNISNLFLSRANYKASAFTCESCGSQICPNPKILCRQLSRWTWLTFTFESWGQISLQV